MQCSVSGAGTEPTAHNGEWLAQEDDQWEINTALSLLFGEQAVSLFLYCLQKGTKESKLSGKQSLWTWHIILVLKATEL